MDLSNAARLGYLDRVRALVEQDAGLVHVTDLDEWTPLLGAVNDGRVEVARYLLDHGARIDHRDDRGCTALHYACLQGHTEVVLLLLQRGADVTAVNEYGRTPLRYVDGANFGSNAVLRVLLEHGGSDVDAADEGGRTACHGACTFGHSGLLRQLLEAGADPTLRDAHGDTASDLAARRDHQAVSRSCRSGSGRTRCRRPGVWAMPRRRHLRTSRSRACRRRRSRAGVTHVLQQGNGRGLQGHERAARFVGRMQVHEIRCV